MEVTTCSDCGVTFHPDRPAARPHLGHKKIKEWLPTTVARFLGWLR